jgi:putative transposase
MHLVALEQGLVVLVAGEPATILKCVSESHVEVSLFKNRKKIIIAVDQLTFLPAIASDGKEIYSQELVLAKNKASEKEINIARDRFLVIGKLKNQEIDHSTAMVMLGVKKTQLYKMLKSYSSEVGMLSLLRQSRGRKVGETRLTNEVEEIISLTISKKRSGIKLTFKKAYQEVTDICLLSGITPPSIGAVTCRLKLLNAKELHTLRYGAEAANQKFDARPGIRVTNCALEVVQMDHALVDVILCDPLTREPIGRPWLTVVIDVHTRVILGYYIGYHHPSSVSVACAMTHAAFPKRTYLNSIGADADIYPFHGVPSIVHMDNAKEFRSPKLEAACKEYDIKPEYRPPGKKHYGGHVERLIGTMMTSHVHFLSGTTFSNTQQRKGYDSDKKSVLSFREFVIWFSGQVAIYHGTYHSGIECSPGDAWNRSFMGENNALTQPKLVRDPFRFRLDFMPEERRDISPKGIALFGSHYWSPALSLFIGLKKVLVKYDPLSLSKIWVKLENEYVELSFADLTTSDCSFEEYFLSRKRNLEPEWITPVRVAQLRRDNESLVKESTKTTRKEKKRRASFSEYADYLTDADLKSRPKNLGLSDINDKRSIVNYTHKPIALPSEDA